MATIDDRTVVLILREFAEEAQERALVTFGEDNGVHSEEDARQVIGQLLDISPQSFLAGEAESASAARRLIEVLSEDAMLGVGIREIIADPPTDHQLAPLPEIIASVVVLGAIISFLQTKIRFHLRRDHDGTHVEFEVEKESASQGTIQSVTQVLAKIVGRE